ncbi:MAG TPA: ATP-binding protein, partial [Pyrinomonadaceae bacterium]|nr:ATP-binding protein [Pyrinomonadaceae bacterium]
KAEILGILVLLSDVTKQRELDRLKAETVQLVSHELRAPLTSIQGLSDVLRKFPVSTEESQEMLATIHSEAIRLNELINRFLDIKRLESGGQNLQISTVNLNELLENCVQTANPFALEKETKIQLIKNEKPLTIQADAQLLKQTIDNLLNNAIKYSPPRSNIEIKSVKTQNEAQIIVKDNGYGIPQESLSRIFDNFYRLERDVLSETIGTGLGLAFVKGVVEKHGGRVTVESQEGVGSIFVLSLES